MKLRNLILGAIGASVLAGSAAMAYELTVPGLVYRTGPYAPGGIPVANGFADYMNLVNEKGGVNGVKIDYVECETGYNTKKGVECYENTKNQGDSGALVYNPYSTGITYQLIPKANVDKIPVLSMGYGRTSAANGKIFPWIFNFPATYWSQATVFIKYIAQQEGSMDGLKGKKIALVYHNSAYGKEPIRTLESLATKAGYELMLLPVDPPGQEQKATWLQIRKERPDWVLMWGWGVMNQVALKEAASIRYPMDKFIGVWWSGSENDVLPAGAGADGYLAGTFTTPGDKFPLHKEIYEKLYDAGKGAGDRDRVGEVLYNRGMINAIYVVEAIKKAMEIHGTKEIRGEHMRDGLEALSITNDDWKAMGLDGFSYPVTVTCENHEGPGMVAIQRWDASARQWTIITPYMEPMTDITAPLIAEDAAAYAAENNVTERSCS